MNRIATLWLASAALAALAASSTFAASATQRQFRHPEAPYTEDFVWHAFDLSGMKPSGAWGKWRANSDLSVTIECGEVQATVSAPAGGVLRLQINPVGKIYSSPPMPIGIRQSALSNRSLDISQNEQTLTISTSELSLEFAKAGFGVTLRDNHGRVLANWSELLWRPASNGVASYSKFALAPDDHFFGLGGKASPPDRRGTVADIYSVKVETKRGDYGGFALPYFVNPRGYGLIVNNPYPRVYFDFGYAEKSSWTLTTPDGPLDLFFLAGPSFQAITQKYHALTGSPAVPPKWMLGLWVSWLTNSPADRWLEFMKRFRAEGWPADATVLDIYWRGGMVVFSEGGQGKNLEWDRENFGDGPGLIKELEKENIHVVLHVNTRMFADEVLQEGLAHGFLRQSGYEQVVSVLENESAREWNWQLYAPRVAEGTAAWWVDNGERVDGTLGNGLPSRNLYGEVWNQFLFERMNAAGLKNRLVLARGGWLGTQTNATQWPGDTGPGVERLREDLWFVENLAMSGVPYSGVDLGGFKADGIDRDIMHTDENIIRRVAHGFLLFPIPRIHNSERAPSKFPWRYSTAVQAIYRQYLELRYQWLPYYYSAAVEASRSSVPMMRPLAFDYPDERTFTVDDELLVGPSLLLAPVMETGAHSRNVTLPDGQWFNYWSGEKFEGGRKIIVRAPLYAREGLPIFVKAGAILPSRPLAQFNQEVPERNIHLDLYPSDRGSYRLWETDDTCSEINYATQGNVITLDLTNQSGAERVYTVACRDGRRIESAWPADMSQIEPGVWRIVLAANAKVSCSLTLTR